MTDIEQLVRESLTRGADDAPHVTALAANAKSAVRRQRRQRAAALGAALGVASLVTAVSLTGSGGQPAAPASTASPAPSTSEPPDKPDTERAKALPAALVGTWAPTMIAGFEQLDAARPDEPLVTFRGDGTWSGSDGCNSWLGTYALSSTGEFSAEAGPHGYAGCRNVPNRAVIESAVTVLVHGDTLSFYDTRMRELGRFGWRAGGPQPPRWPGVHVPDDARLLSEPQDGVGSVRLTFAAQPVEGKQHHRFGLRIMCVGGGKFTVTINGEVDKRGGRPCDGVPLGITVVKEQKMHEVVVSATKGRFQVAVIDR